MNTLIWIALISLLGLALSSWVKWRAVATGIICLLGVHSRRLFIRGPLREALMRVFNMTIEMQHQSASIATIHQNARPFYVDNWLWDTFRALEPLQTLLNPEMEADKIQSYVRMYQPSGNANVRNCGRELRIHKWQSRRAMVCRRMVQRRAELRFADCL